MSYSVKLSDKFNKRSKTLKKRYPSLQSDILRLIDSLELNPLQGQPLGKDMYKIRLAIRSKGRGKSGGARVITLVKVVRETVVLLDIYDKAEIATLTNEQMRKLLE